VPRAEIVVAVSEVGLGADHAGSSAGRAPALRMRALRTAASLPGWPGIEQADGLLDAGRCGSEAAVLNACIPQALGSGQLKIGVIGAKADLTYSYDYLGAGTESLSDLAAARVPSRAC